MTIPRSGSLPDIVLISAEQVQSFLRATNKNRFQDGSESGYVPSTLEKQFVALTLSVRFDEWDKSFGASSGFLGSLKLINYRFNGLDVPDSIPTIQDVLDQTKKFLDGDYSFSLRSASSSGVLSAGELTKLLDNLNLSFDGNPYGSDWAKANLSF